MKHNTIRMFLAVSAACLFGSALNAQSNALTAKVPFAFQVAGKDFQPGRYLVRENGYLAIPSVQNMTSGESVFVAGASHALTQAGPPKLVFHCYAGKTCFLSEIHLVSGPGSQIATSKAEKQIVSGDEPHAMALISVVLNRAD